MICLKCNVELAPSKVNLDYLGNRVVHEFLVCPKCGNLYIPENIVNDKMLKLESKLEDK